MPDSKYQWWHTEYVAVWWPGIFIEWIDIDRSLNRSLKSHIERAEFYALVHKDGPYHDAWIMIRDYAKGELK